MTNEINNVAERLENLAYENDFEEMVEYFSQSAGIAYREDDAGEYKSAHVLLTFGPTIQLDTATGEIYCYFYNKSGRATLSLKANKTINEFLRAVHDC